MGESPLSTVPAQGTLAPGAPDPEGGEVLPLRRAGLWLPALLAMLPLASVACAVALWVFVPSLVGAEAPPVVAQPLRIAGWVALAGAAAAGALAWARRRPSRLVLQTDGLWMPRLERASASVWVPYRDVCAVHPWTAWRLRRRRCLVLGLRGRVPRFWSARAFADPEALERLAASVRAGVARLPDAAERLREMERRAVTAAAAQRGWPGVTLAVALVLTAVHLMKIWLETLPPDGRPLVLVLLTLANGPEALTGGEPFRLITGNLLHSDAVHLAVNLVFVLGVGVLFERLVGGRRFLIVLLGGALGGMVASSALAGQLAAGASAGANAALACWIYVFHAYRDEVPGNFYVPLWFLLPLWLFVVAANLVPNLQPGNIEYAAHAGGFAAGLVLSALVIRGRPLATLARRPSRLATGLAVGLLAVYAGGVAWGGVEVAGELRADEREALELALRRLGREHHPRAAHTFAAWQIATSTVATPEALRAAQATVEQVVREEPETVRARDTLATLHFRLGDAETAAAMERRVLRDRPDNAFTASQLARFERARLRDVAPATSEDRGVLVLVVGPARQVRFDPPVEVAGVVDVYAVVEEPAGALGGLVWLTLRCGSGGPEDCAVPARDLPSASSLVVTHVAPAPEGAEAPMWRFWPLDPEVAALPGPLPLERLSPRSEEGSP